MLDQTGESLGWATTTFPHAEKIQGYSGPSELLVLLDPQRRIEAVSLLQSSDTDGHVQKVKDDTSFWQQWTGQNEARLGAAELPKIVSGATLTSEAMARGLAARFGATGMDQWFPKPVSLGQISKWFPKATRIEEVPNTGTYQIFENETGLGWILRSSRMGVSARGFNGTSDVIVALDEDRKNVLGVGLLASRDNEPYVGDTQDELKYADGFAGRPVSEILASPEGSGLISSGASRTADAVIESTREMLRRDSAGETRAKVPWKFYLTGLWIALGLLTGFTKFGANPKVRTGFAVISVVAGLTLGWMVSQDQLIGWAGNGFDFRKTLPLIALTVVALFVPAFTGKNIYCSRICPHGAAQSLAGQVIKRRFALPKKLHAIFQKIPWLTLIVIWGMALFATGFPFAHAEPFETWSSGFQALLPATIFTVGLIAAFFLPQAYCHYGCPTGALLKFLTHAPGRWTTRDSIGGGLVLCGALIVFFR